MNEEDLSSKDMEKEREKESEMHLHWNVLFWNACSDGYCEEVRRLIKNVKGHHGWIHGGDELGFRMACANGRFEVIRYLLTAAEMNVDGFKVNLHAMDEDALRSAFHHEHWEVVKYLLTSQELIEAGHAWANVHAHGDDIFFESLKPQRQDFLQWLILDYQIECTRSIELMIRYHPQAQDLFRIREERKKLQETIKESSIIIDSNGRKSIKL